MTVPANITRFLFEIPNLKDTLRVVGFDAEMSMSSCYRCELELACENAELDLASLIGQAGLLTLVDARESQYLHGQIVSARQEDSGRRFTSYRIALQPKLGFLGYRTNLRIFQDMSVPDIAQKLLDEAGITSPEVRFELKSAYPRRTYCTQYRETDLAFLQRLFSEEGIFYFFEHDSERHTLVVADTNGSFKPIAGKAALRYKQRSGMVSSEESIYEFEASHHVVTGKVSLRDYNFEKPRLLLDKNSTDKTFATLETYHYPAGFQTPEQGKRYAELGLQALQAESESVAGQTDCARLAVGKIIELEQHPRKDLNARYSLTRIVLQGRQPQSLEEGASAEGSRFDACFVAIPAALDYRAARRTPKPAITGSQTALVTGPAGEEIYTDRYGRIKIQFHWDREAGYNEASSCWVRVSQGWAGHQWGSMVIPRVGQEVIVSFLNGDPDQPLVTGTAYNGASMPPYALPANKTRSTFKSLSSPGGGGYNELRIEDKKGSEEIYLHAEKDLDLYAKNDLKEWVGNERHQQIKNNLQEAIGKHLHIAVAKSRQLKTGKSLSRTVGGDQQIKITGACFEQAGQDISLKAGMTLIIEAGTELTLKAGGGIVKLDPGGVTIKGPMVMINTGGAAIPGLPAMPVSPAEPLSADKGDNPVAKV